MNATPRIGVTMISEVPSNPQLTFRVISHVICPELDFLGVRSDRKLLFIKRKLYPNMSKTTRIRILQIPKPFWRKKVNHCLGAIHKIR